MGIESISINTSWSIDNVNVSGHVVNQVEYKGLLNSFYDWQMNMGEHSLVYIYIYIYFAILDIKYKICLISLDNLSSKSFKRIMLTVNYDLKIYSFIYIYIS